MKPDHRIRLCGVFAAVLLLASVNVARAAEEEVVSEHWSVLRVAGDEAGWLHEKNFRIVEDGRVRFRTETFQTMEMMRFGQNVSVSEEGQVLEDENGRVISMHKKSLMSDVETIYRVDVSGDQAVLTVTTMGKPSPNTIPWDSEILGPIGIYMLRTKKGYKAGTSYSYKTFMFEYAKAATVTVSIVGREETELLEGEKAELIHAVSVLDLLPVKVNEWWNDGGHAVKTSMNMMGISIETFRTNEERAKKTGAAELKTDVLLESMARSNVNLPNPYSLDSILYRFEVKDPELGFPEDLEDLRQKIVKSEGTTNTVHIRAVVPDAVQKRPLADPPAELLEYLEPNPFLQSDDPKLKAKALEIVGSETDAWKAACLLENFVFRHISDKNFGTAFASASEVLEKRTGDCSEHGVLLAALCRAAGIPSRVAMGYMYLGGIFGGHMWVEVWIDGEWYPIDGVMGIGRVDPTHICFSRSSLKNGGLASSFASAVQGLGNLDITILEFSQGGRTVKVGESFKDFVIAGDNYTNILYGISLSKPAGYTFENYERDFSNVNFTLVEMEGESDATLRALPAAFSFNLAEFRKQLETGRAEILYEMPRKIDGRKGAVYMVEGGSGETTRLLALIDRDTCFVLRMRIEDEERDVEVFERIAKTISFE